MARIKHEKFFKGPHARLVETALLYWMTNTAPVSPRDLNLLDEIAFEEGYRMLARTVRALVRERADARKGT